MRVAHLADLHIGFRRFERTAKGGMNQREADVQAAVTLALDDVIAQGPEVVVLAGDVFHSVRPPNASILFLFGQLTRLRQALPATTVVMIGGDHDTPRSSDGGVILPLFKALGVQVAPMRVERFWVKGGLVTAVPKASAHQIPAPDPAAVVNVLVLHGEVRGFGNPGEAPGQVDPATLADWDYVALGHYHAMAQVAPNAWYAGALEYTTTDPWHEPVRKGWILATVEHGHAAVEFRPIGPPRPHLDLGVVDAGGMSAAEANVAIAAVLDAAPLDGAVGRLRILMSREARRDLDHDALRAYKARALNLAIEVRESATPQADQERRARRFQQLDEVVGQFLGARELPPDVDRAALQELSAEYLRQVNPEGDT